MIRLRLLGSTELTDPEGRELTTILTQSKRLALLAYLAANPGFHRRDTLLAMFWPELDTERSRDALNQAVSFLRKELGAKTRSIIVSRGATEIGIDAGELWCDATAFQLAISERRHRDALELYRGDLLVGFFADGTDGFEQWLDLERSSLRTSAARAATHEANALELGGDSEAAILLARRAVELAGLDERVVRELLERLDRLGDRAGALHAYDVFVKRLSNELNTEPAAETTSLVHRIRSRAPAVHLNGPFSVAADLQSARPADTHTPDVRRWRKRTRSRTWLGLGIAGGTVAAAAGPIVMWRSSDEAPAVRVTLELLDSTKLSGGSGFSFAMSRDGNTFAFIVGDERNILVRRLDDPIGTLWRRTRLASDLHFSPDGSALAYRIGGRPSGPTVLRLDGDPAISQPVPRDTTLGWSGITWGRSKDAVFVSEDALWRMSLAGKPILIASMDTTVDRRWRQPVVLSDGETIAMRVTPRGETTNNNDRLALLSIDGGWQTTLDFVADGAIGDIEGVLIYSRNGPVLGQGQLFGVRMDLERRRVWGPHVQLIDSVDTNTGTGAMATLADNGSLAYVTSYRNEVLQLLDARGGLLSEVPCPRLCSQLAWSPDGQHIAMYTGANIDPAIAVYDLGADSIRHLSGASGDFPSWTSDSKRIVFTGTGFGPSNGRPAMWVAADGSSPAEQIPGTEAFESGVLQALITPDEKHLIVRTQNARESLKALHAFSVPLGNASAARPTPIITDIPNPYSLEISPDGKWLAYTGPRRGGPRAGTFIQPLMGGGGRVQVSAAEGFYPRWTADGRKIVYTIDGDARAIATLDFSGSLPRVVRTDSLFTEKSFTSGISSADPHPRNGPFAVTRILSRPPELKLVTNFSTLVRERLHQRR